MLTLTQAGGHSLKSICIRNVCELSDEKTSEKYGSPRGVGSGIWKGVI